MAEINEVYRIYEDEDSWKDVTVTSASGDTIDFIVCEVVDIPEAHGVEVDQTGSVDLATVESDMLYDKDGVTTTEEALDEVLDEAPE